MTVLFELIGRVLLNKLYCAYMYILHVNYDNNLLHEEIFRKNKDSRNIDGI